MALGGRKNLSTNYLEKKDLYRVSLLLLSGEIIINAIELD